MNIAPGSKCYIQSTAGAEFYVYPAATGVQTTGNRRRFVQATIIADDQIGKESDAVHLANETPVELTVVGGRNEFMLKAIGTNLLTPNIILTFQEPSTTNQVPGDSLRMEFWEIDDLWLLVSSRNNDNGPNTAFTYPTDGTRTMPIQRYPDPTTLSGVRDQDRPTHVVVVHGYNRTLEGGRNNYNEFYKRLQWIRFRGNLVGFTWHGDEGWAMDFDDNEQNALQTSPALINFLGTVRGWAGSADNVDVVAHSLGNLVMCDAIRLHERLAAGNAVRNAICVEAAVWSETYTAEGNLVYDATTGDPPPHAITYIPDEQEQHSWRFWFNQTGRPLTNAIGGSMFNSSNAADGALVGNLTSMTGHDALFHSEHYDRSPLVRTPTVYRGPEGQNGLQIIPALLRHGMRRDDYDRTNLSRPIGATTNPMATTINARLFG